MSCCPTCELKSELARVCGSPLLAQGGYATYRGLFDRHTLTRLVEEAMTGPARSDEVAAGHDTEQVRGGEPARLMTCVEGGVLQSTLFLSHELGAFIAGRVKGRVRPCGTRASYTIYSGAGSHLDIHRDIPGCDLALITCLHDDEPGAEGGALEMWPNAMTTPLGAIRAAPESGRVRVPLEPGDTLLLHGGLVPHRVPPRRGERIRIVSLMCFEVVDLVR